MKRLQPLVVVAVVLIAVGLVWGRANATGVGAPAGWRFAYAHNAEGKQTGGDLGALIEAVNEGKAVRVVIDQGDEKYAFAVDHLFIRNGIVTAQSTPVLSARYEEDGGRFKDDSYYAATLVSSKGVRDQYIWSLDHDRTFDSGQHRGVWHGRAAIKWFVAE